MDKVITPTFRVSFPSVFDAKAAPGSDKEKYSVVMLFKNNEDLTVLKDLAKRTIAEKWGGKTPKNLGTPFKDGNGKDYEGYKDTIYLTASSQFPPGVIDEQKQPIIDRKAFYAGCYAIASVNCYGWEYMGKSGVSFGLQNIMKMSDGDSLSGGATAEQDFGSIPLPEVGSAPTGGDVSVLDL